MTWRRHRHHDGTGVSLPMPSISLNSDVQTMAYPKGGATAFILLSQTFCEVRPLVRHGDQWQFSISAPSP